MHIIAPCYSGCIGRLNKRIQLPLTAPTRRFWRGKTQISYNSLLALLSLLLSLTLSSLIRGSRAKNSSDLMHSPSFGRSPRSTLPLHATSKSALSLLSAEEGRREEVAPSSHFGKPWVLRSCELRATILPTPRLSVFNFLDRAIASPKKIKVIE